MTRDWYGVVGHPVLHSLSPNIFHSWFDREGRADRGYVRITAVDFSDVLAISNQLQIKGLNVTSPFKVDAARLAHRTSSVVRKLDAANILIPSGFEWYADNTDPDGVASPLIQRGLPFQDQDSLVVGAGGAARAAVHALDRLGARITVLNRRPERAQQLSRISPVRIASPEEWFQQKNETCPRVIVWTIPAYPQAWSMKHLSVDVTVLDANYRLSPPNGYFGEANVVPGTEWLYAQALAGYRRWFRKVPEPAAIPKMHVWYHWKSLQAQQSSRPLVLTGFMGSGKTTVAAILADRLGCSWMDTDASITASTGKTIPELFKTEGESRFRDIERATFLDLVNRGVSVISCGGGLPMQSGMPDFLKKHCLTVCLCRSLDSLDVDKLQLTRPLLSPQNVHKLFDSRRDLYLGTADLVVACGSHDPRTIARLVMEELVDWRGPDCQPTGV